MKLAIQPRRLNHMTCPNCTVTHQEIEFTFTDSDQTDLIQVVRDHLYRHHISSKLDNQQLTVNEKGAIDLRDFCYLHSNPDQIYFRVNQQSWQPLAAFDNYIESAWIDDVIKDERIINHFQPIVTVEQEVYGYELLARFTDKDEQTIYPDEIFSAAKARGRLFALDRICRLAAVRNSVRLLPDQKAFINFIPTAIYTPEFCLATTTQLADQLKIDQKQLVFEVVETEKIEDIDHLKSILSYYKSRGFHYALDDVGEGYSTIDLLCELAPHYMKLDIKYVQGVADEPAKQQAALRFLAKANEIGSIPLAEGIETQADFDWLREQGYQLFQGYLFGKPAPEPLHIKTSNQSN